MRKRVQACATPFNDASKENLHVPSNRPSNNFNREMHSLTMKYLCNKRQSGNFVKEKNNRLKDEFIAYLYSWPLNDAQVDQQWSRIQLTK